jgi:hypothetical protein
MALHIAHSRINGVSVVHISGAIFFDQDSISLRVDVKDLLDKVPPNRTGPGECHSNR